ncbi:MAG TPA: TerB family tellurite resistance protein [Thermoanaerobaculia bacterium]|nr:TerB family tellurite resistance protein [Thermoanaerobaculia bacterium]
MLRFVRELLADAESASAEDDPHRQVRVAVAALLQRMAAADFSQHPAEQDELREGVRRFLDLEAEEAAELIEDGRREAAEAVSLYDFTEVLHRELELEQKVEVVELLWQVAYSDGAIHPQEEHLVRKVAALLHVPHGQFIGAKHRARGN